jgi:hypothetical protein
MTIRFCKVCKDWHDLDKSWPEACLNHFASNRSSGPQIIKDIDPYKTVAADVNGKQVRIAGRRQHREFLARNNYREVGNDIPIQPRETRGDFASGADVKRAIDQLRSRN